MIRVLGGPDDPGTRLENRVGEPAANPYLYILSQIVAGVAGIEAESTLPPPNDEPYAAERPMLPQSLPEALDALDGVGPVRKKRLLTAFGSPAGIRRAALDEIAAVKGMSPSLAAKVKQALEGGSRL